MGLLPVEHAEDVADDLANVVVRNLAGPTCANTFRPVDEQRGDDGDVPLWLHTLVVIIVVLEQVVIHLWEKKAGQGAAGGEGSGSVKSSTWLVDEPLAAD